MPKTGLLRVPPCFYMSTWARGESCSGGGRSGSNRVAAEIYNGKGSFYILAVFRDMDVSDRGGCHMESPREGVCV